MLFAYWMVLAAGLLPYATVVWAKTGPGFDNAAPRPFLDKQTGLKARADWAHRNHFEAFGPFAAAVIIAGISGASHDWLNGLAGAFIVLRILYTIAYLTDRATLRSILFMLGMVCVIGLFVSAAFA
jgi:uncharacterized MAPEG superfamily protein